MKANAKISRSTAPKSYTQSLNLADVLLLRAMRPSEMLVTDIAIISAVKSAANCMKKVNACDLLRESASSSSLARDLMKLKEELIASFDNKRASVLSKTGFLEASLVFSDDAISFLSTGPSVSMQELRKTADKLGFLLMPYEYLSKSSYSNESYSVKRSISGFNNSLGSRFEIYALAPIDFYDLKAHVDAERDFSVYAGAEANSAFISLQMVVPMLRVLSARVDRLEQQERKTAQEIENLHHRLQGLEIQVENQRREQILAAQRVEADRAHIVAMERPIAQDPILFAFEKGESVCTFNGPAFLGPCWGPDFDDLVLLSLGFTKIEGQRAKIKAHAKLFENF